MVHIPSGAKPVTQKDLKSLYSRIEKMVSSTVGEIVGDALQIISERFNCIEDKMDSIAATVDHHTIDTRELQRKTA